MWTINRGRNELTLIRRSANERGAADEARSDATYNRVKELQTAKRTVSFAHVMFLRIAFRPDAMSEAVGERRNAKATERKKEREPTGRNEGEKSRDTISNCSRSAAKLGR